MKLVFLMTKKIHKNNSQFSLGALCCCPHISDTFMSQTAAQANISMNVDTALPLTLLL